MNKHESGIMASKEGKYCEALILWKECTRVDPKDIDSHNRLAQVLRLEFRQFEEAISEYNKVLKLDPHYPHALFRRGICKGAMGDLLGQERDWTEAIRLFDKDLNLVSSRMVLRLWMRNYATSIEDANHVLKNDPQDYSAYQYKGRSERALGNFSNAEKDFESAMEIAGQSKPTPQMMKYSAPWPLSLALDVISIRIDMKKLSEALKLADQAVQYYVEEINTQVGKRKSRLLKAPETFKLRARVKYLMGDITGFCNDTKAYKDLRKIRITNN